MAEETNAAEEAAPEAAQPTVEELQEQLKAVTAERDDARRQSRKWEGRSKDNAEKAKAYDALAEKSMTAEERADAASERARKAEKRLAELEAEKERSAWNGSVSKETGVPVDVLAELSADSEESLKEKAEKLKGYFDKPAAPVVESEGRAAGPLEPAESANDWLRSTLHR